jgi:hypothetical protein
MYYRFEISMNNPGVAIMKMLESFGHVEEL